MNVFYWNNCWFTNVGEAFIDIGAMEFLKKVFENFSHRPNIVNISDMSSYYHGKLQGARHFGSSLRMEEYIQGGVKDYVVFSGMFISKSWLNGDWHSFHALKRMVARGARAIFLGVGQEEYSKEETSLFVRLLEELDVPLVVTRDRITYENLLGWNSGELISGIDCAFWVKDVYNPRVSDKAKTIYDVVTYNRSSEPNEFLKWDKKIVRAWHMQDSFHLGCIKDNQLISDTPYDYLTIYANADKVYTDLVHATCIALQYGKHVRFSGVDNRVAVIDALDGLKHDSEGLLYIEEADLETQKEKIVAQVSALLQRLSA